MTGRGLRLEPEQLGQIKLPCILHWDMNHFVVLKEVGARKVTIHDPASACARSPSTRSGSISPASPWS